MTALRVVLALAVALGLQTGLGKLWPATHRFFDPLLVPVVVHGLATSQRAGMIVGCAAGLLRDAWFEVGPFGLNGFKWTLLGWALGGLGGRFDLNHPAGRLLAGVSVSLADTFLDVVLRRLLDQQAVYGAGEILLRAALTGVLVLAAFAVGERIGRRDGLRRLA